MFRYGSLAACNASTSSIVSFEVVVVLLAAGPRETPQNSSGIGVLVWGRSSQQKTCNISEMGQDRTKVTIDD